MTPPLRRLVVALALCAPLLAGPAFASEPSALVVADDGGLRLSQWRAMRGLALGQLRKRGANVLEIPELDGVRPLDAETIRIARAAGAKKFFVLRISGQLGAKVPLSMEELDSPPAVAYTATMTAATIDDCEQVLVRLVDALLSHSSAEETATRASVTKAETRPYNKKATEKYLFVGLPLGLYRSAPAPDDSSWIGGVSVSVQWETESFRLGPTALVAYKGGRIVAGASADLSYLPLDGQWTPFIGGGLGYFGGYDGGGFGAKGSLGVEAFRLYAIRLNVGVDVLFPFYESTKSGNYRLYPLAHLQFGW